MDKISKRSKRRRQYEDKTSSEKLEDLETSTKKRKLNNSEEVKETDPMKCEICNISFMNNYRHFYKHKCSGDECKICKKMHETDLKLISYRCGHIERNGALSETRYDMPQLLSGCESSKFKKHKAEGSKSNTSKSINRNSKKCKICETVLVGQREVRIEPLYCKKCKIFSTVSDTDCLKHSQSRSDSEAENVISEENKVASEKIAIEKKITSKKLSNESKVASEKAATENKSDSEKRAKEKRVVSKNIAKENKVASEEIAIENISSTSTASSVDLKTESDSIHSTTVNEKSNASCIESTIAEMIPENFSPYVRTEYVSDESSGFLVRKNFKKRENTISITNSPAKTGTIKNSETLKGVNDKIQLRKKMLNSNQVLQKNVPNILTEAKQPERRPRHKKQEEAASISVVELKLELVLADVNTGVLVKHSVENDNIYQCVKCNKKFSSLVLATNHFIACDKKVDKTATVNLANSVWFCILCRKHLDSYTELLKHKMSCSEILMQRSANDTAQKKLGKEKKVSHCEKCGYSCLSPAIFVRHKCGDRLKRMMNCVVDLNVVPAINAETTDKVIYFHCSVCDKDFFDSNSYQDHMQNKHPSQYDGRVTASSLNINKPVEIKLEKGIATAGEPQTPGELSESEYIAVADILCQAMSNIALVIGESQLNSIGEMLERNQLNDNPQLLGTEASSVEIKCEDSEDRCTNNMPNAPRRVSLTSSSSASQSADVPIRSNSLTELYKETVVQIGPGSLNFSWNHSIKEVSAYAYVSLTSVEYICKICYEDMPRENLHEHFRMEHNSAITELNVLYVIDSREEPLTIDISST